MKLILKQARPEPAARPRRPVAPADVGRTWATVGLAGIPVVLVVLCLRSTAVAQPTALFVAGLPAACAAGAFGQRRRRYLVGADARAFSWMLRGGGLVLITLVLAAHGLAHTTELAALLSYGGNADAGSAQVDLTVLLAGPADAALIGWGWSLGGRLYSRMCVLEVQAWEQRDESQRIGRQQLLRLLWHDTVAGALIIATALWVLWHTTTGQPDYLLVALLTVGTLVLYVSAAFTLMARLTAVARRASWALEGITPAAALPSAWTRPTMRGLLLVFLTLGVLAASPLLGLIHRLAVMLAVSVFLAISKILLVIFGSASHAALQRLALLLSWPPPAPVQTPVASADDSAPTGPHMLLGLLLVLVLSWVIWWILIKVLDRMPALAGVASKRPARALWSLLLRWLRRLTHHGQQSIVRALAGYRTRRLAHRSEARESRLEDLPPRPMVVAAYRRALRRAGALGWRRPAGQTPTEFAARLEHGSAAGSALSELTEAFVEARYSDHPISPARAGRAVALWRLLRRKLRYR